MQLKDSCLSVYLEIYAKSVKKEIAKIFLHKLLSDSSIE